ncbi:HD-GYP domain-containing protein [Bacillus sp. JJ1764]|uniref:HD-GYP domain-containing protein n=1 Tax=Bacillus sp. JJ1764 TaxID=3122964 RepID=UPI00300046DA
MKRHSYLGPLAAVIIPYLVFEVLYSGVLKDTMYMFPNGHFYIVSVVSILASMISIAIGVVGVRIRNIKVSFLSLSFLSLAILFSIHGLSTPHFLLGSTRLPGISAQLSMLLAASWMSLSALPSDNRVIEFFSKHQRYLHSVWTVMLCIFGTVGMMYPNLANLIPLNVKPLNILITAVVFLLNGFTIYRYYYSYRYSRFPLQIAIVYSSGWITVSQIIMVRGVLWASSWWIYHFLLLASMIVMIIGLYKQYSVKGTLVNSVRSLFTNDPFERVTHSIIPSVKALVTATEKKDTYTAGHTLRVTMYALKLAEELHLKPEQLRIIVQGGLVHDVGKIRVPDTILNKPGKLTAEERVRIERHPIDGYDMCRDLGFMKDELEIIRFHHEKWDGTGYPDQLKGQKIPYFARIVAVADVYDALTSERAYRKPWPHQKAMEYIKENSGTHFDPQCVMAWERLCERNPLVYEYPSQFIKDPETIHKLTAL